MRILTIATQLIFLLGISMGTIPAANGQVNWPTYGFTYENTRYVPASDINRANVSRLALAWRFSVGPHEHVETTPIVIGDTMYLTQGVGNNVIALDAQTGKEKWRFRPAIGFMSPCCGAINRGIASEGGRIFFATLDAQLIALDARNGRRVWRSRIGKPEDGLSETMAPLAWNGIVFIGSSGSDFGVRGSISAYNAQNGKLLWRWYAVSTGWEGSYVTGVHGVSLHREVASEKKKAPKYAGAWNRGGGAVWMTPALDVRTGTLVFTTSNPSPVFSGDKRPGDNLYTECIVALDARTGAMRWYYQQTPHDVWEYEPSSPPVLFAASDPRGRLVPAVGEAGKNRWFYILRRDNGKLLRIAQYAPNRGVYDPPSTDRDRLPFRGTLGPISYDSPRHLAFVNAIDQQNAGTAKALWRDFIAAVNVDSGHVAWTRTLGDWRPGTFGDHMVPGSVSTSQLLFVCEPQGMIFALDAASGTVLWRHELGQGADSDRNASALARFAHRMHDWLAPLKRILLHQNAVSDAAAAVYGSPVVYRIAGREYVAVAFDSAPGSASGGAELYVFTLPGG